MMNTYYGKHPLQVVLKRTAWHPAKHTRQLMLILETLNIKPDRALTAADFAGLPLPDKAWDDERRRHSRRRRQAAPAKLSPSSSSEKRTGRTSRVASFPASHFSTNLNC